MWLSFFRKLLILLVISMASISPAFARTVQMSDLFFPEQTYLSQMKVPQAWQTTTGSSEVVVALLDAGFDLDHEDLQEHYWVNAGEIPGNGKDDDANGYDDDVQGWDFVDSDPDPSPDTSRPDLDIVVSHGTLLAGIIGAVANNGKGIVGINHEVSIMPLRVLDQNGSGSSSHVRQAIKYAVENGAQVINLSFTFKNRDDRLREMIRWAFDQGVVVVAAVGNDHLDTDLVSVYPACYDKEIGENIVIGVAAVDTKNKKAAFSNYGKTCTDLAAPGTDIFGATYHDSKQLLFSTSYGGPWEGTSIAAPMVTGTIALLKAQYPSLTPDQIRNVLKLSVDPIQEPSVEARLRMGAGVLNSARALEIAAVFSGVKGSASVDKKIQGSQTILVAEGAGSVPLVTRVDGQGKTIASFLAYHEAFRGGVELAMGDVTGDGIEEIVTGAGRGGGPQVRVFDLFGNVLNQFFAFETEDRLGLVMATGDLNNDGVEEIVVTRGKGGSGQVRLFNRSGQLQGAFYPFGRTTEEIHLAVANMDEDAELEIISASMTPDGPAVRMYDGNGRYVRDLFIREQVGASLSVAGGDVNGDGINELVIAAGKGYAPLVLVYDQEGVIQQRFFAYDRRMLSGLSVQVGDRDQNGRAEIYTAPKKNGGPHVRMFDATGVIGGFFVGSLGARNGAVVGL